ncbi:MAG: type I-U CRISPR-associated protein Csb2 [Bdellovibrionota bacterium]
MIAPVNKVLLVCIRFHDGRYHGLPDWPPSSARLFQALVAGAAERGTLSKSDRDALEWLENLSPPTIAAPITRKGQSFGNFVPNNDQDSPSGKKASKQINPRLFDSGVPLFYAWNFNARGDIDCHARNICGIAERLYQFGRGVDMAWAWGEVIDESELETRLVQHGGAIYRPSSGNQGNILDCPMPGSLASIEQRFIANRKRFAYNVEIKKGGKQDVKVLFAQPPKPRFKAVAYNSSPYRCLFELRTTAPESPFAPWPPEKIGALVVRVRDAAANRLESAFQDKKSLIERVLIGRNASEADKAARVHIIPLPSIGHIHADRAIRRVMVEVPANCPIRTEDIAWAFSGLVVTTNVDTSTGEVLEETRLVRASDFGMFKHYGVESGEMNRLWRTVTPTALPEQAARRRIDPCNIHDEAKSGAERLAEEARASTAVLQALRHAGVQTKVETLRLQREPFSARGARSEVFAPETRFAKERLWHVEVNFAEPLEGPLIIGDGRYMGLGLMEPIRRTEGVFAFGIVDGLMLADPIALSRALRRAVMARVQTTLGNRAQLPMFFTGHEVTGEVLRKGNHRHLAFASDLERNRLLVLAPHLLERRSSTKYERENLEILDTALEGLTDLRAGAAGYLKLLQCHVDAETDTLFVAAKSWKSLTEYRPTRYARRMSAADALVNDVLQEIHRRGLAMPEVEIIKICEGPRGGISGHVRLNFKVAQAGPILIGRTSHLGGGLMEAVPECDAKNTQGFLHGIDTFVQREQDRL